MTTRKQRDAQRSSKPRSGGGKRATGKARPNIAAMTNANANASFKRGTTPQTRTVAPVRGITPKVRVEAKPVRSTSYSGVRGTTTNGVLPVRQINPFKSSTSTSKSAYAGGEIDGGLRNRR